MRRLLTAVLLLTLIVPCLRAQKKELSQARTYIKSGKDYDKAEQLMAPLLTDTAGTLALDVRQVYAEAILKQYETVNCKVYVGEQYDTVSLFNLTRRLFLAYEALDSIDAKPDERGRVRPKLRKKNAAFLLPLRTNLFSGGAHLLRSRQPAEAYRFFDTYIDCRRQPLFSDVIGSPTAADSEAAFWALFCGYQLRDTAKVFSYADAALTDSTHLDRTYRYLAETYRQCNDTARYVETLRQGFDTYINKVYFSTRLIDYYNDRGDTAEAMTIVDKALAAAADDSAHVALLLLAKSSLLLNTGRYDECAAVCDTLIALCDTLSDAYYNAGVAYVNKAFRIERYDKTSAEAINRARDCYRKAQPYMERYRALRPDDKDKWAAALYNIYLRLNLGRQFEEIDKLLR